MSAWLEPLESGRCSKWKLRWTAGSGTGRRSRSKRFDGGKREAQTALRAFEAECEEAVDSPSFGDWWREWNDRRLRLGHISEGTWSKYRWYLTSLGRHLDGYRVDSIPVEAIESAYAALKEGDSGRCRPWSGTTLRTAHNCARTACECAVARGLATSNPFQTVKPPKLDTKERKALSAMKASDVLACFGFEDAHEFAVSMMLRTGMRAGECVGVLWSDVDDDGLHIRREVTKTDAGVRVIPLDKGTQEFMKKRWSQVASTLEGVGAKPDGTERLCCTDDGRPMTYNALRRWWERHRREYGLDGWTLHEMRHTYLTNLAQAGVHPSVMQKLAGHASINPTLAIYTHAMREDMVDAVDSLARLRENTPEIHPRQSP